MNLRRVSIAGLIAVAGFVIVPTLAQADDSPYEVETSSGPCDPYDSSCEPCEWDETIPADHPDCQPPCETDPSIPARS